MTQRQKTHLILFAFWSYDDNLIALERVLRVAHFFLEGTNEHTKQWKREIELKIYNLRNFLKNKKYLVEECETTLDKGEKAPDLDPLEYLNVGLDIFKQLSQLIYNVKDNTINIQKNPGKMDACKRVYVGKLITQLCILEKICDDNIDLARHYIQCYRIFQYTL